MCDISDAIDKLAAFSRTRGVRQILTGLNNLMVAEGEEDRLLGELTTQLRAMLIANKKNIPLVTAIYDTLLALVKRAPINTTDFSTGEEITDADKVVVSTGHQFSIRELIRFHNARPSRATLRETDKKYLLNPFTNQAFAPLDLAHILAIAQEKSLVVPPLKTEEPTAPHARHSSVFFKSEAVIKCLRVALTGMGSSGMGAAFMPSVSSFTRRN